MTLLIVIIAAMAVLEAAHIVKEKSLEQARRFYSHRLREGVDLHSVSGRWFVSWSDQSRLLKHGRCGFGIDYAAALKEYEMRKRRIEAKERGEHGEGVQSEGEGVGA